MGEDIIYSLHFQINIKLKNVKAPKLPSFIKHNYQFKNFDFKPRYYNEEKERLEKRKRSIKSEVEREKKYADNPTLERHARMRIGIEDTWKNRRVNETRKSNFRIAIIIAILVAIILVIKNQLGI